MSPAPRALIVYESMFGNSEKIATAIRDGLAGAVQTELIRVDRAPTVIPEDVGLLVVGGPTHALSMSRPGTRQEAATKGEVLMPPGTGIREWIDKLGKRSTRTVVATFDTRLGTVRQLPTSAARSAWKALRRRGFRLVAAPKSFYVTDVTGPIDDDELARAKQWGGDLGLELKPALERRGRAPR